MPERDWRLERPDFSDREKYEAAGWVKIKVSEGYFKDKNVWVSEEIGSGDPLEKFMTSVEYENEKLGLFAITCEFFDQGVAYTFWGKDSDPKSPYGAAIKVGDDWILKDTDEISDAYPKIGIVKGREIIIGTMLVFLKKVDGRKLWDVTASKEIEREILD